MVHILFLPLLNRFLYCHPSPPLAVQPVIQLPLELPVTGGLGLLQLEGGCQGKGAFQLSGKPASLPDGAGKAAPGDSRIGSGFTACLRPLGAAVGLWIFEASVTLGGMNSCSVSTSCLQTRSLEQQPQQHLGTCQKCKCLGPNPDLLYQKSGG